jgi:DNA-directed RNA polymerase specialized sigma24 family protein
MLDEAITAACHTALYASWSEGQAGVDIASEPERVLEAKEGNKDYQKLLKATQIVDRALEKLSSEERNMVDLFCWSEFSSKESASLMGIAHRSFWKVRERALKKLTPCFLKSETMT